MTAKLTEGEKIAQVNQLFDLGIDLTQLVKLQSDIDTLSSRLVTTRAELLKLRPGAPNYDQELARLSSISNAIEGQLAAARGDWNSELTRLKLQAIDAPPGAGKLQERVREIDGQLLGHLFAMRELAQERDGLAAQLDDLGGVLGNWMQQELGTIPVKLPSGEMPWRTPWPGWKQGLLVYVQRFTSMLGGNPPEPGADQLAWFSRKVW